MARVAAALQVETSELFIPLIPSMIIGFLGVLLLAYLLGLKERQRLGLLRAPGNPCAARAWTKTWATCLH